LHIFVPVVRVPLCLAAEASQRGVERGSTFRIVEVRRAPLYQAKLDDEEIAGLGAGRPRRPQHNGSNRTDPSPTRP
jgi:hypothetical protein